MLSQHWSISILRHVCPIKIVLLLVDCTLLLPWFAIPPSIHEISEEYNLSLCSCHHSVAYNHENPIKRISYEQNAPNKEIMPTSTIFALILTTIPIIIKIIILFYKLKVHQRLQTNAIKNKNKKNSICFFPPKTTTIGKPKGSQSRHWEEAQWLKKVE